VAASQQEIISGLAEIIEEVTGIEPSEVTPEKSFVDDLDIDSLSMVEIAVQAEDKFGVKIPDDELANLKTVGDAMTKLVAQLTRPVRWDLCTESLRQHNVTAIIEFPPAGTLTGIAKRELRGVPTHAVKSPADLDGLSEL